MAKIKEESFLWNYTTKVKFMHHFGNSLGVGIPDHWLKSLKWGTETPIVLSMHTFEKEIILKELVDNKYGVKRRKYEEVDSA